MERIKTWMDENQKAELSLADLPDLELYMDQIITLFSDKGEGGQSLLTKTMINNYSKEGLIQPIKGKKYSKDHILQMLLVYRLKQTMSIQQIKGVMACLSQQAETQKETAPSYWERICEAYEKRGEIRRKILSELLSRLADENALKTPAEDALFLLELSDIMHQSARICDRLVEEAFSPEKKKGKKD